MLCVRASILLLVASGQNWGLAVGSSLSVTVSIHPVLMLMYNVRTPLSPLLSLFPMQFINESNESGAVLPSEMWTCLVDPQGLKNNQGFSRIHKDQVDLVVLYADPRRSTDEFRVVSSEFNKLPLKTLGAVCTVVNVDDSNDHRKLLKKLTGLPQYSLFSDPTKGVMDLLRCRGAKRVTSCA